MKDNLLYQFTKNDDDYFRWLNSHQDGYVLNTTRVGSGSYLVLHKSTCPSISEYGENAQKGGFTEREYIKICADNLDLIKSWVRQLGKPASAISQECYCWKDDWW